MVLRICSLSLLIVFLSTCLSAPGDGRRNATTVSPGKYDDSYSRTSGVVDGRSGHSTDLSKKAALVPPEKLVVGQTKRKAPELLSRYEGTELKPLPLKAHDISVVVVGHRVRVVQDLVFENPTPRILSGTMMTELPDGATPTYLGMFQGRGPAKNAKDFRWLNPAPPPGAALLKGDIKLAAVWGQGENRVDWGQKRSARVVNPVRGRRAYESIVRRRVDPALAEWAGAGKFSTRVYPIPSNSYKRVVFAYERPLRMDAAGLNYTLPLPRQIKAKTRLRVHVLGQELLTSELKVGSRRQASARRGNDGTRSWTYNARPGQAPALKLSLRPGQADRQILVGADPKVPGKLVHLRYKPVREVITSNPTGTGRAMFLLDTSYSMEGSFSRNAARMLTEILENDTSITEFFVLGFDVMTHDISGGFLKNTPAAREALIAKLGRIHLEGATDFSAALQYLQSDTKRSLADTYFLLSDGNINWGEEKVNRLARLYRGLFKQRWICYSFGDGAVNRTLFRGLARHSGRIINIGQGQSLKAMSRAHQSSGLSLESAQASPGVELVLGGDVNTIYPGQFLEIALRVKNPALDSVQLKFKINGKWRKLKLELGTPGPGSAMAARAWANLYCNRLLELNDSGADELALALSQRFHLSNRAASFIILETDAEYKEHQIKVAALDLAKLKRQVQSRDSDFHRLTRNVKLPEDIQDLLRSLARGQGLAGLRIWDTPPGLSPAADIYESVEMERKKPLEIYRRARRLRKSNRPAHALRVLSTVVEQKPRDDQCLRMTAYVLMEWGFYSQAEVLFARSRRRRPFESQNYVLEGAALAAQNKVAAAALRFEVALNQRQLRFNGFIKPVVIRLYGDLLQAVLNSSADVSLKTLARKRLNEIGIKDPREGPVGRLILFWNLDNSDVDLHVLEDNGDEVYYGAKTSYSGGKLFWDNTRGLGPELYEHPNLSEKGFRVLVKYFGNSDVEGAAPATTLAIVRNRREQGPPRMRWYGAVLDGVHKGKVDIMPPWKR